MQQLPNARLVVHPRGARHLVDSVHLIRSATGVYGEAEIERSYALWFPSPRGASSRRTTR
jgi:hypothetical protein